MKLHCTTCDRLPNESELLAYLCDTCGKELELPIPSAAGTSLAAHVKRERGPVWRYGALLPVAYKPVLDDDMPTIATRSRALEERSGAAEVWLINATTLGTGTFKDYEAAVVAAMTWELGVSGVSVHSTGNTALAYLHYMSRVGVSCAGYIPTKNLVKVGPYKSTEDFPLIAVDAEYALLSATAKNDATKTGRVHLAPLRWKLEGKAALGLAIQEYCPQVEVIVQTVAGGYGPLGCEVAFRRLRAVGETAGVAVRRRYALYQAGDSANLARAWSSGAANLAANDLRLPDDPFEPTLQSTNPLATLPRLRAALPQSSTITAVSPNLVEDSAELAVDILADLGIPIDYEREKSAVISIAGVLASRWSATDRLAIVVSGSARFPDAGSATVARTIGGHQV